MKTCQIIEGGQRCAKEAVAALLAHDERNEPCTVRVCAEHFAEAQKPHPPTLYMSTQLKGVDHEQAL